MESRLQFTQASFEFKQSDHRLIEFATQLEPQDRMKGFRQKVILRNFVSKSLPKSILKRSKSGFGSPIVTVGKLSITRREDLLNPEFSLLPEYEDVTYKSFSLAALAVWLELFNRFQLTGKWKS